MSKIMGLAAITISGFVAYSVLFSMILGLRPVDAAKLAITGHLKDNPLAVFHNARAEADSIRRELNREFAAVRDSIADERRLLNSEKAELLAIKDDMSDILETKKKMEDNSLYNLAKIYNDMDPIQLAGVMIDLDDSIIVTVLPKMKKQKASRILEMLPPDRAASISSKLLGKK